MGYTFRVCSAGGVDAVESEFGDGRALSLCRPSAGRGGHDRRLPRVRRVPQRGEHPEPIVYVFGPDIDPFTWKSMPSTFRYFVTVHDFDRKHGRYEANRREVITRCTALLFNEFQSQPARLTSENYLSINADTLGRVVLQHTISDPGKTFQTRDLRRFFEQSTNSLNEAERWLENLMFKWDALIPEKRKHRHS
jgi:hypothetical protein